MVTTRYTGFHWPFPQHTAMSCPIVLLIIRIQETCSIMSRPLSHQGFSYRFHKRQLQSPRIGRHCRGPRDNKRKNNSGPSGNNEDSAHQLQRKIRETQYTPSFFQSYHSSSGLSQEIVDLGACAWLIGEDKVEPVQLDLDQPCSSLGSFKHTQDITCCPHDDCNISAIDASPPVLLRSQDSSALLRQV